MTIAQIRMGKKIVKDSGTCSQMMPSGKSPLLDQLTLGPKGYSCVQVCYQVYREVLLTHTTPSRYQPKASLIPTIRIGST